jgi:hypothetical protein
MANDNHVLTAKAHPTALAASMPAGVSQGRSFDDRSNSRPAHRTTAEALRGPLIIALTWQARAFTRPTRRHSTASSTNCPYFQLQLAHWNATADQIPDPIFAPTFSRPYLCGRVKPMARLMVNSERIRNGEGPCTSSDAATISTVN